VTKIFPRAKQSSLSSGVGRSNESGPITNGCKGPRKPGRRIGSRLGFLGMEVYFGETWRCEERATEISRR
jgi:hypothetical protein